VNGVFDTLYEYLPRRQRGFVEEHTSVGTHGSFFSVAYASSMKTLVVEEKKVLAVVCGVVDSNYSGMDDAEYVLNEYKDACDDGRSSGGGWMIDVEALAGGLKGDFVALVYDKASDRLVIVRGEGKPGTENGALYWGKHNEAKRMLVFSDEEGILGNVSDTVHAFPKGHVCVVSPLHSTDAFILPVPVLSYLQTKKKKRSIPKVESANNCVGIAQV